MKARQQFLVAGVAALAVLGARGADWPCFTGPNHDNTQPDAKGLASAWPTNGPKVVWEAKVPGGGAEQFASPVVGGGRVFVMSRQYVKDATGKKVAEPTPDILTCLDAKDGRELWQQAFAAQVPYTGDLGHERKSCWNTPVADGGLVYARGPNGELRAIGAADGKTAWTWPRDPSTLTNKPPSGYALSAPCLVVDDILILPVYGGFKAKVLGLDKKTGEEKWAMPEYGCWQFSAGCMIPLDFGGGRKGVVAGGFVFDPRTGTNLMPMTKDDRERDVRAGLPCWIDWSATHVGNKLISGYVANEVKEKVNGSNVVTKAGEAGIVCVELALDANGQVAQKTLWKTVKTGDNRRWQKSYGGPVVVGENVYVFHGCNDVRAITCISLADGTERWNVEKPLHDWGYANVVGADGKIFYAQGGWLTMLAADPAAYRELAAVKFPCGWSTPALAGTRLYTRDDAGVVRCLELAAE
jgi:outer membrane protein assembly factor BamB